MGDETNVYEAISRRLFSFAHEHFAAVRDDRTLSAIYTNSNRDGVSRDELVQMQRDAQSQARFFWEAPRSHRNDAAELVRVCLSIRNREDSRSARLDTLGFATDVVIAEASADGCFDIFGEWGISDILRRVAQVRSDISRVCSEYASLEATRRPVLAELSVFYEEKAR